MNTQLLIFGGRRLLALVLTVVLASMLIFAALALAPGDPAATIAGTTTASPATLDAIRQQFHLDDPIWIRYFYWARDVASGHFGTSYVYNTSVISLIAPRMVTTFLLVAYSAVIILVIGVASGAAAALRPGRIDKTITVLSSISMGAPTFVIAIILIFVFTQLLNWFPVFGTGVGLGDRLWHLTLPAVALSLAYVAYVSRMTRTAVRAQMFSEHVETASSRGLSRNIVVRRHIMFNASPGILSVSGLTVAGLFAGAVVAEKAFAVNGIGSLLVDAASRGDLPLVQIISLFIVVIFVVINSLVDLAFAIIDPRTAGAASN